MLFRQFLEIVVDILFLFVFFVKVQNGDEILGDWDKGVIILIFKKVVFIYCKNLFSRMIK